jgi:hypothetical protein
MRRTVCPQSAKPHEIINFVYAAKSHNDPAAYAKGLDDIAPTCFFEQDSRQVLGLEVADLVAHTCAVMLLAELGLVKKTVKAAENSGYDPDSDMELEFELWAGVRYSFFAAAPPPPDQWESQLDFQVDVEARGLHVAATCDPEVRRAALARFGSIGMEPPQAAPHMTMSVRSGLLPDGQG